MKWSIKLVSLRGVHPIETPDGKTLRTLRWTTRGNMS
jgi:hypothetical protein